MSLQELDTWPCIRKKLIGVPVHTHTYIYIYTYMYMHTHICSSLHLNTGQHINACALVEAYTYMHMYNCIFSCWKSLAGETLNPKPWSAHPEPRHAEGEKDGHTGTVGGESAGESVTGTRGRQHAEGEGGGCGVELEEAQQGQLVMSAATVLHPKGCSSSRSTRFMTGRTLTKPLQITVPSRFHAACPQIAVRSATGD